MTVVAEDSKTNVSGLVFAQAPGFGKADPLSGDSIVKTFQQNPLKDGRRYVWAG